MSERKIVDKVWGSEEWVVNNDRYCGKVLWLKKGYQCSLHYHPTKHETFLVLSGVVRIETMKEPEATTVLNTVLRGEKHDSIEIPPMTPHRFSAPYEDCIIIEFSTHHDDEDVVRISESGRIE